MTEDSNLTFGDSREFWTTMMDYAKKKKKMEAEVQKMEKRRDLLETLNEESVLTKKNPFRLDNLRIEDTNIRKMKAERQNLDSNYLQLIQNRRRFLITTSTGFRKSDNIK